MVYLHHSDVVSSIQLDVVHLGDKDGGHGHKESGAVHVNGRSDGTNKLADPPINTGLLETLETDGESCCSGMISNIAMPSNG